MGLTSNIKDKDWVSVRQATAKLGSSKLGPTSTPIFAGIVISGLTASRLVWADAAKELASKDLVDLVAGTANRVTVTDDSTGGVTLSGPQDIHVDATPEFAGITIKDSGDNIIFYVDDDELYFTAASGAIVAGNPIGLLLLFTYPS